jgi:hypothetical protein
MPGPVAHGPDDRLDEQSGHRPGQIQQRQLFRLRMQEGVKRIDGGLLQSETVLYPEESDIHVDDLPETQRWPGMRHVAVFGSARKLSVFLFARQVCGPLQRIFTHSKRLQF